MLKLALCFALGTGSCLAQVSGSFTLDKAAYAPGEPVFLTFTLRNDGKDTVYVNTADPYAECSGYSVQVERQPPAAGACILYNFAGSCLSSDVPLAPGQTRTDRILLNHSQFRYGTQQPAVRLPGDYTVHAERVIRYGPTAMLQFSPLERTVRQDFYVRVDPDLSLPSTTFDTYIAQLRSDDPSVRSHAALTLATVAPPELELFLLTFASSKDFALHEQAPDALSNLNTPRSLEALAGLVEHEPAGSYTAMHAADLLGQKHDAKWFPLLLAVADRDGLGTVSHQYAGKAGGAAAVNTFAARLRSANADARMSILYALAETGSVAAIPLLIDSLAAPSASVTDQAASENFQINMLLQRLTHHTAMHDDFDQSTAGWRERWQQWWRAEGSRARAYYAEDCGPVQVIP